MIKQGTRKSLRTAGTLLLVNRESGGWDEHGNYHSYVIGGDYLMVLAAHDRGKVETVNIATGQRLWMWRTWLVKYTSLAFDARDLVDAD